MVSKQAPKRPRRASNRKKLKPRLRIAKARRNAIRTRKARRRAFI